MKKMLVLALACAMMIMVSIPASAVSDDHTLNGVPLEKGIYEGQTIRIASPWATDEVPLEATEFMEHTGLNIIFETIPAGDDANGNAIKQYIINAVAANDCPDVIYAANFTIPLWVDKNIVQPWNDYIDFSQGLETLGISNICETLFSMDGKIYGIGDLTAPLWNSSVIFYRISAFEDAGLDDPYTLFQQGEWTWDVFSEMCQELTYDGGSGTIDHYGLTTWFPNEPFVTSNGGSAVEIVDGKPVYALNSPEAVFGLNYSLEMPAGPDLSVAGPDAYFLDGSAAMYYEGWWFIDTAYEYLGDDLGFVPFPLGPDYDETPCRDYGEWCWVYHLSSTCEAPQAAADYLLYLWAPKQYDDPARMVPADYSMYGGEEKYREILTWAGYTAMDVARGYGDLSDVLYENVWWSLGSDTPANLTESIAQEAQAIIDDVMK